MGVPPDPVRSNQPRTDWLQFTFTCPGFDPRWIAATFGLSSAKSRSTKHLRPHGHGRQKQAKRNQCSNLTDDNANHPCLSERRGNIVHALFQSQA
jgi:hypothetical protein